MNKAKVQAFVDDCVSRDLSYHRWFADEAAGILLSRYGLLAPDAARIAAYIVADRETLRVAELCGTWPNFDFGPSVEGVIWGWYNGRPQLPVWPIPFFTGDLEHEAYATEDGYVRPPERSILDRSFDGWTADELGEFFHPDPPSRTGRSMDR